jgi:hypothetical protein
MPELPLPKIRKLAGWSRDRAAVEARVAYATARLYEACPSAVVDPAARARLDATYARIESEATRNAR